MNRRLLSAGPQHPVVLTGVNLVNIDNRNGFKCLHSDRSFTTKIGVGRFTTKIDWQLRLVHTRRAHHQTLSCWTILRVLTCLTTLLLYYSKSMGKHEYGLSMRVLLYNIFNIHTKRESTRLNENIKDFLFS